MLIVFTTVSTAAEGDGLAAKIVEAKLAACVQILPPMRSAYVWEGKLQNETEHLLLIKTLPEKYAELETFITANHAYDVPEIIAVDAAKVAAPYLNWLRDVLIDS